MNENAITEPKLQNIGPQGRTPMIVVSGYTIPAGYALKVTPPAVVPAD